VKKAVRFSILAISLSLTSTLWAQSDRGTITGTVTDETGAVVAGAKITATNAQTGESRTAESTGEGGFTIPELKAGRYSVRTEMQGFQAHVTDAVDVAVQTTRRVNIALKPGGVQETVSVTAEGQQIQTETAALQTNVSERQVRELPLAVSSEVGGRTPLAFIFLDSNVNSASSRATDSSTFSVSGGQGLGTEILVDGATTRRVQNGTFFAEVAPGPNAFQEFTVSTNTFSAEYGSTSGGIVNFTLKSGGNNTHGEAYWLYRNERLNANEYVNNSADPPIGRRRDHQNDLGFNIGGPLSIPGLFNGKDKAFYFFNYEGYRFSQAETVDISIPTMRMRTGDFSELLTDPYVLSYFGAPVQIYDPTVPQPGRTALAGNIMPAGMIDPAGTAILALFPEPTSPGVFRNYRATSTKPLEMNNYVAKGDYVLTEKQRISMSYSYRTQATLKPDNLFPRMPAPVTAFDVWDQKFGSHFARIQHDYTISPTLLNHFNLGFNRVSVANRNTSFGQFETSSLGIPANATENMAFPRVDFPGYGDILNGSDPRSYQPVGSTFFTDDIKDNSLHLSDSVTWATGRHTLKFGADMRWQQFNALQFIDPGGAFNFRHDQTAAFGDPGCAVAIPGRDPCGWPIASLLAGATEWSFATITTTKPAWRYFYPAFFVNDDIKLTQKLTLNVGFRYEIPNPRVESQDRYRGFDPTAINPLTGTLGALSGADNQGGVQAQWRGLVPTDYSAYGPRIGAAYALDSKTVLRGGFGIFYAPILYFNGLNNGTQGYRTNRLTTPNGTMTNAFLSTYPAAPTPDPGGQFLGSDVEYFNQDYQTGRTYQWSFDVQRELPWKMAGQIGYIGHIGRNLRSNFQRLNALDLNELQLGWDVLRRDINAVTAADIAYAQSVGVTLPANGNAVYPGFTGNVAQALRPFPQYGRINNQLESQGTDDYHAMQLRLSRQFANGFQFGASYTWSKHLTDASDTLAGTSTARDFVTQNIYDRRTLRSVSPNSTPHVFVFNYLYELPFGRNRAFLNNNSIADKLFGGWQISAIHRYESGLPISIRNGRFTFTDEFLNIAGIFGSVRPNIVPDVPIILGTPDPAVAYTALNAAAFSNPAFFNPGQNPGGCAAVQACAVTDPGYAAYYADPSVFFGNAPAVLGNARLHPFLSENVSLLKKTSITERFTLELRGEFFNFFNRHRFGQPEQNLDAGNFGEATVLPYAIYPPRQVQLGARLIF
jgi:hypothetical protein